MLEDIHAYRDTYKYSQEYIKSWMHIQLIFENVFAMVEALSLY